MTRLYSSLRFLIISLVGILILASCKIQDRAYNLYPDRTGWAYTFKKDNTFRYDFGGCLGYTYGTGKYEISGDTIRFIYDEGVELPKGKIEISKIRDIQDSIIINMLVKDSVDHELLPFYSAGIYQSEQLVGGFEGNAKGELEIMLPSSDLDYKIELVYVGYPKFNFFIKEAGQYSAVVYLSSNFDSRRTRIVEEFKLITLNRKEFIYGGFDEGSNRTTRMGRVKN